MKKIARILVPVDFSEASEGAVLSAIDLARAFGAEVTCLHVLEAILGASAGPLLVEPLWTDVTAVVRRRLEELVRRSSMHGVRLHAAMSEGTPYVEIVRLAEEHDMVVMSTSGRTGLAHLLLGSVAERVVRSSPVPVVTIRG